MQDIERSTTDRRRGSVFSCALAPSRPVLLAPALVDGGSSSAFSPLHSSLILI